MLARRRTLIATYASIARASKDHGPAIAALFRAGAVALMVAPIEHGNDVTGGQDDWPASKMR